MAAPPRLSCREVGGDVAVRPAKGKLRARLPAEPSAVDRTACGDHAIAWSRALLSTFNRKIAAAAADLHRILTGRHDHGGKTRALRPAIGRMPAPRPPSTESIMSVSSPAVPPFGKTIVAVLDSLMHDFFGPYRPERHYMRGPGPKWREKHRTQPAAVRPASVTDLGLIKATA
jgi:hypothetical protein